MQKSSFINSFRGLSSLSNGAIWNMGTADKIGMQQLKKYENIITLREKKMVCLAENERQQLHDRLLTPLLCVSVPSSNSSTKTCHPETLLSTPHVCVSHTFTHSLRLAASESPHIRPFQSWPRRGKLRRSHRRVSFHPRDPRVWSVCGISCRRRKNNTFPN